jgi:hypothetical protein
MSTSPDGGSEAEGNTETPPWEAGEVFDCPGCAVTSEDWPHSVLEMNGQYWHPICFLESHPQVEKREPKDCPECGASTPYRPVTRAPEARSCWVCINIFPEDADRREDIEIIEEWDHERDG